MITRSRKLFQRMYDRIPPMRTRARTVNMDSLNHPLKRDAVRCAMRRLPATNRYCLDGYHTPWARASGLAAAA